MKVDILTLFPEMFSGPFDQSIVKRAKESGLIEIYTHNMRGWATDKYKSVDDRPYGGGAGMVMRVDIIDSAVTKLRSEKSRTILLDASGTRFSQKIAKELSEFDHLILIAGHYEGIDHRVHDHIADEVVSIGNYVLSGGEIPAMVVVDAVTRLLPGALGNPESLSQESFSEDSMEVEYPQYTRPEEYKGWRVPEVLLSGDHKKIVEWKSKQLKRASGNDL